MATVDKAAAVLDSSSVMTDIRAFARGFELQRKPPRKKDKQKYDPATDEIEPNMKVPKYGLLVWSPKAWNSPWCQFYEDLPEGTLAAFEVAEAAGELTALQTYPNKELWEDYCSHMERISADEDEGISMNESVNV